MTIKHAIIACHPDEESFVLSMARRYAQTVEGRKQQVVLRDLYRLGFDPVLRAAERQGEPGQDVQAELAQLGKADVFVLVYPIWFGSPPAMLKGYVDRVFGAGRTVGSDKPEHGGGTLSGKRLVTLTSSASMRPWLEERGVLTSMQNLFDRYLKEVFSLAGTDRYHFDGITSETPEREIRGHLTHVERAAREVMSRFVFRRHPGNGLSAAAVGVPAELAGSGNLRRSPPLPPCDGRLPKESAMSSSSLDRTLAEQSGITLSTRSGTSLRLRPATLDDGPLIAGLFARLSPESLRFRFLDTRREPTPADIAAMIGVDHRHCEHVLAFDNASSQLVGSLMMVADERMETAEVAIVVAEDVRGRGIGWSLLKHAADLARERGVRRLRSVENSANHDALEVEHALGFSARAYEDEPGLVVVEADLA